MVFEKIDRSSWKRNEYFENYFTNIPCTYSMTVKLDITQIKKKRMKLYPAMLYYLATIVTVIQSLERQLIRRMDWEYMTR